MQTHIIPPTLGRIQDGRGDWSKRSAGALRIGPGGPASIYSQHACVPDYVPIFGYALLIVMYAGACKRMITFDRVP